MPAAIPLGAAAIGAVGSHLSQRSANQAADRRTAEANRLAGQDYQNQLAWQQGLMSGQGVPGQLFSQMTGPQTSTGSGSSSSVTKEDVTQNTTRGLVKTPELLATRTRAEQAAAEVPYQLAGLLQRQFGAVGRQQEADEATTRNFLASRGASPADARMAMLAGPATRNANAARLSALGGVEDLLYGRQAAARQEQASIEQMLADQFENMRRQGTSTTRGTSSSTQTGPGNIGAALSLLAPPQRQVYV